MSLNLQIDRGSKTALYQQIAEQIKDRIAGGGLPATTRLPPVRRLATEIGVTRLTVQNAYAELQSGGWVEATVGRGTFVSPQMRTALPGDGLGNPSPESVIRNIIHLEGVTGVRSLASASPDPRLFPADEFWAALSGQRDDLLRMTTYSPSQGDPTLRVALCEHLREQGIHASPDELLVTNGVSHGLALIARALTRPGDVALVEEPTYVGFLHSLKAHGLTPISVPMDEEGPDLTVLERLVVQQRPRFFYTVPTFQNPTGHCMSLGRRKELLALAKRHGLMLVEDDIYAQLAYDEPPPPSLKALDDEGLVVYASSFSKTFMPGLRLGYVMAQSPLAERLLSLRRADDLCGVALLQRALAHFLQDDGMKRHLRRVLPVYRQRRDAALNALQGAMPPGVVWTRPSGGFCTWLTLPEPYGFDGLQQAALEQGYAFAPGASFLAEPTARRHLRICFGNQPPETIQSGIELLARLIREQMERLPTPGDWTPLV